MAVRAAPTNINEGTELVRRNAARVLSLLGQKKTTVYWTENRGKVIGFVKDDVAYTAFITFQSTNMGNRKPLLDALVIGWPV